MNEDQSFHDQGQFYNGTNSHNVGEPTSDTAFPFLEMGTSFVIGLAVGYFLKKSFKFLLLLLGLGLVILFVLESEGYFKVNDEFIQNGVSSGVDSFKNLSSMLKDRLSNMQFSSGVGAVAGFFAGLKFG